MRRAAVLFFLVASFFAASWRGGHYNSPDETANAFFIRQYVQTGSLRVAEPLNIVGEDIIHPRAVAIIKHDLAPGSFLGMLLLYGWIAKIFGLWIVPFLTPLFATIASLFFYKLLRLLFDDRIARWSFFLLLIHPAWIYYTARSMFPNVLFLSLLIIGLYAIVTCYLLHATWRRFFIAAVLVGAALAVRTAEAPWVLGVLALLWYAHRREIPWQKVVIVVAGIIVAFLPIFYHNTQLYGNPFYNGYSQIDSEAVPAAFAWHLQSRVLSTLFSLLLPFGIKPFVLLSHAYQYGLWFFWWLAIPMILGFVLLARSITGSQNQKNKSVSLFLCFFVFAAAWLLLYYGSWEFRDTTLTGPTLGTSFTRYWLPFFVFGIPVAVHALFAVQRRGMRVGAMVVIVFLSLSTALLRGEESLLALRKTAGAGKKVTSAILARTQPDAVIVTERTDKLFFPGRRVIFNDPLDERKIDRIVATLRKRVPVYYFTELEKNDIDFMNERRLSQHGVAWRGEEEIGGQRLYHLENVK